MFVDVFDDMDENRSDAADCDDVHSRFNGLRAVCNLTPYRRVPSVMYPASGMALEKSGNKMFERMRKCKFQRREKELLLQRKSPESMLRKLFVQLVSSGSKCNLITNLFC